MTRAMRYPDKKLGRLRKDTLREMPPPKPQATPITSKYGGRCAWCHKHFEKGTKVIYNGATWHPKCWKEQVEV